MNSAIFGKLTETKYDDNWLESLPIKIPFFDDKELLITLVEKGDQFIKEYERIFKNFIRLNNSDRINGSDKVIRLYEEYRKAGLTQELNLTKKDDIWNYVYPNQIILHNWTENETYYVCVECGCDWDIEHGVQLCFKNGEKLEQVTVNGEDCDSSN